jgi:hypothetical protein
VTKEKHLFRILFLASIFLLLLNDLVLKYEFHNYLTGKVSDLAGLFAFPYFIACFFPRKIKPVYLLTGILFVFWKSEFSQPIFNFFQNNGIGIDRTVDYSDLFTLLILPISYKYWNSDYFEIIRTKRILKPMLIGVCCFSFIATTLPKESGELNMKSNLIIDLNTTFENAKKSLNFYESSQEDRFIYRLEIPRKKASIRTLIKITENINGTLKIKLDSILNYQVEGNNFIFSSGIDQDDIEYIENLKQFEIEKLFVEQLRKKLK